MKPTIVLVHGAFAESSSWDGVIDPLLDAGHPVIAAANPLRGLASDAAAVADVVRAVEGPVVLAAHSYGGAVISNVPADAGEIVGLVYACGFAPEPGEHCFQLAAHVPGQHARRGDGAARAAERRNDRPLRRSGQLPRHLLPGRPRAAGRTDGHHAAPGHPGGAHRTVRRASLWSDVPSRFVIGEEDHIIPAALQHYMAERARRAPHDRDPRRLARDHGLAPRGRRPPDPGGRGGRRGR